MSTSWERYPNIRKFLGAEWLKDEKNRTVHPLLRIRHQNTFLTNLDKYLKDVPENKSIKDQLNPKHFYDIYYELEIAYFLRKLGLRPTLHATIGGTETDILLEQDKLVVEVRI